MVPSRRLNGNGCNGHSHFVKMAVAIGTIAVAAHLCIVYCPMFSEVLQLSIAMIYNYKVLWPFLNRALNTTKQVLVNYVVLANGNYLV